MSILNKYKYLQKTNSALHLIIVQSRFIFSYIPIAERSSDDGVIAKKGCLIEKSIADVFKIFMDIRIRLADYRDTVVHGNVDIDVFLNDACHLDTERF